jgi:hypothetical protein
VAICANYVKTKTKKQTPGVFSGIDGVSSAVIILFVLKLRLLWILRCKISAVLCQSVYVNEQYEEQVK